MNQYREIINHALSLPKHEPKRFVPVTNSLSGRIADALMIPPKLRRAARDVYNISIDVGARRSTLATGIAVDQLHRQMAIEINRISAEAILRGGLPLKIFIHDRFLAWIDFGHGRTLRLFVELHTSPVQQSTASFIVEENHGEINFDLVPEFNTKKKETRILSASIRPHVK